MGQSKALSCNISALRMDALDAVDVRDVFLEVGHGSEGLQNMGSRSVLGTQYDVYMLALTHVAICLGYLALRRGHEWAEDARHALRLIQCFKNTVRSQ